MSLKHPGKTPLSLDLSQIHPNSFRLHLHSNEMYTEFCIQCMNTYAESLNSTSETLCKPEMLYSVWGKCRQKCWKPATTTKLIDVMVSVTKALSLHWLPHVACQPKSKATAPTPRGTRHFMASAKPAQPWWSLVV